MLHSSLMGFLCKKYTVPLSLTFNIVKLHAEEKTAQCDQCGKFFKNSHNVRNHQSRMHPGKPEQFEFQCSKCGQGTHSLTAHRCIRPGEMHGSRRRRAPRNAVYPPSFLASASLTATTLEADVAALATSAPAIGHVSPSLKQDDQHDSAATASSSVNVVDCSPTASTAATQSRPPSLQQPLDCNVGSRSDSRVTDQSSMQISHGVSHLSSPGTSQQSDSIHYLSPQTSSSQSAFDHRGPSLAPFDPQLTGATGMTLDRHLFGGGVSSGVSVGRSSYHATQSLSTPAAMSEYDRRLVAPPSFQSQQPAVAHQPPQQPPYSNLFAVDPLLQQLRAANVMYRVDYS